ncbi:MAG: CPBP family intramembrane metalloprotease [Clostridiales Family XIII bacterium]|jgi:membrane protease YdiL (CAAX protease family)|nr:CPBP family intramembrane metalloprotease [Clostridiales Family XIII bacterium]
MRTYKEIRPFAPKENMPDGLYSREVKVQLRKVVLAVGAYFLVQIAVSGVIEVVLLFSSGLMNDIMQGAMGMVQGSAFDYNDLVESSTATAQETLSQYVGLIAIISAVAGLPVFLLLRGKRLFTTDLSVRHAPLSPQAFMRLWIIAMGAQFVFNMGAAFLNKALESSGHSVTDLLNQSIQMMQTPSGLLYVCIVGPIVEEIVFRGAIMRSLERFGLNFSIVISSLVFGLFHIFTIQAVFAFFMGIILGYIASRYSLKHSILAHILINSVATGVEWFGMLGGGADGTGPFYVLSNAILFAFFIGAIVLLVKERWRFAEQRTVGAPIRIPGSPERTGAALWSAAFTSVPLLVYIAVTLLAGIGMIFLPGFTLSS